MADDDATARRTTRATKGGPAKKAAAKRAVAPPAKAVAAKKAAPVKAPASRKKAPAVGKATAPRRGAVLAPRKKAPPPLRLAAEQTFDDDWDQPEPEPAPVREDPGARVRGILRAAALSLEAKEAAGGRAAPAPAPPAPSVPPAPPAAAAVPPPPAPAAAPAGPDEPVTRVLVAPVPPDPELDAPDDEVDDSHGDADAIVGDGWPADDTEAHEEDWSPPEVLDDERAAAPAPPPPPAPPAPASGPATDFSSIDIVPTPQAERPARPGPGLSILAIVLAVFGPIIGAIVAFFLAGRARRRGAALAGLARVVAVLALVAWVAIVGVAGYRALRNQGVDYSKLKVGDCFKSSQSNEVRGVKVQQCSKPHNSEIFFLVTHPAGPTDRYPGKDALVQFAADTCLGKPFTDYIGVALEASKLKDFEIVPQESAWKEGRRTLVCGIDTAGQGDITASVKGTRR